MSTTRRILASTGAFFAWPLEEALSIIADAGYDGAELMVTQDPATQDADRLQRAAARVGVPIPVIHGPFLLLTRRVFGTDPVTKARRSLELAAAVGADLMIVHPPYRWQHRFHHWLLDEGQQEAASYGCRLGVENLYPLGLAGRPVRFHRYTRPEDLLPFPDVVFDTSHFAVAQVDILRAYELLADRTAHLHISDNRGHGRDSHAPLGHGILPLGALLGRVAATGPPSITLELDCRRYLDDRAALVGFLRQEREKCMALLDGAPAEEVLGRPDTPTAATEPEATDGLPLTVTD